jgi:hypothetical protein
MGAYVPLRIPTMWWMEHCHLIDAILCILEMLLLLLTQLTPRNSTMGIATCSASRQQPVQKVTTTKTPTPKGKHRLECQLSRSPRSVEVNTILADINLPQTRFKAILTVLGPEAERNDKTEANPAPPADNNPADEEVDKANLSSNQISPSTSPNPDPTNNATVRINETLESDPPMSNPMTATTPQAPRSILRGTPPAEMTDQNMTGPSDFQSTNNPSRRMILDRHCKLLINLGEDGHNKAFHVEDFIGLYPAWPIVEVAILPTEDAKEERMNMFVKCITALFGEILYIDDYTAHVAEW